MTSVDGDIKKVSHDCLVQNAKSITQLKDVFVENKDLNHIKEEVALLKNMVHDMKMFTLDKDGKRIANGSSSESKIDKLGKEFSTFKATVDLKLADVASNHSNIVHSCMSQIEEYIGTVLLEEIVSMINMKLNNVKVEYELESERVKIKLDDLSIRYTELKHKVADMEMPMRTFDESALYSYDVDEVVTPVRLRSKRFRMTCGVVTPSSKSHYVRPYEDNSYIDKNSACVEIRTGLPEITVGKEEPCTLNETVGDDKSSSDCGNDITFAYDDKISASTISKVASLVAKTRGHVATISKELSVYQAKLSSYEELLGSKPMLAAGSSTSNDTLLSLRTTSTEHELTMRKKSWGSRMKSGLLKCFSCMN